MSTFTEIVKENDKLLRKLYKQVYDVPGKGFQCITCGIWTPALEIGHLYGRDNKAVRFHFHCTAPQCRSCNNKNNGERRFYEWMVRYRYGKDAFSNVLKAKHRDAKTPFMQQINDDLNFLIAQNLTNKEFLKRIGQKNKPLSFDEIKDIRKAGLWEDEWKTMLNHF